MSYENLHKARKRKNDEFYTLLPDIEKELKHYKEHFKDKVIYANCDREESNFVKYFTDNFEALGLKEFLFSSNDFRSPECIEIMKEADIIVTNPPFSLFREYVAQLIKYDKKFIIIGNQNAITYKEVFRLLKRNKIWLGYSSNKTMEFGLGDSYTKWDRIDMETGRKYGKVPAISWYTNLEVQKRHENLILYKKYYGNEDEYPKYDNYDAINLDKTKNIPIDYDGVMGVPISFMNKYNPEQFEIIGSNLTHGVSMSEVAKKGTFTQGGPSFYTDNGDGTFKRIYTRILIKHKRIKGKK